MTGSGIFPKVDGDVLYAYDVNTLRGGGTFLAAGSTPYFTSGTLVTVGSFVIPANTLTTPSAIVIDMNSTMNSDRLGVFISGISYNRLIQVPSAVNTPYGTYRAIVGSPCIGGTMFSSIRAGTSTTGFYGDQLFHLNPADPIVVYFQSAITDATGASGLLWYVARAEGRGY